MKKVMDGIRNRRGGSDVVGSKKGEAFRSRSRMSFLSFRSLFYLLILTLVTFAVIVVLHNSSPFKSTSHQVRYLDRLSVNFGIQGRVYVVVIDAGSTGSRVLAYTFLKSSVDDSLKLEDELWHEVKPGLSSFKDDPEKGAQSLLPLLDKAKAKIPQENWNTTPIILKATAGLRLLPKEHAENLLSEVSKVLSTSGFFSGGHSVEIMEGRDEGVFSWFTVNYLFNLIQGSPENTLVALDLGGGSTQITFLPTSQMTLQTVSPEFLTSVSLFNKEQQLFTRSYLGLGLMAGRTAVLSIHMDGKREVRSPCVSPIVDTEWEYHGQNFRVRGPENPRIVTVKDKERAGRVSEKVPVAEFSQCYKACVDVIKAQVLDPISELKDKQVIAFSYFFDKAAEQGMIDPYEGGSVRVKNFLQVAKEVCETANADQPFACLDLTFIAAFLHDGYGLSNATEIKLLKKIDGKEVSWALGLAFHVISSGV